MSTSVVLVLHKGTKWNVSRNYEPLNVSTFSVMEKNKEKGDLDKYSKTLYLVMFHQFLKQF